MKRTLAIALGGAMLLGSSLALAEKGDWLVRVRAVNLDMENKSDPIPALGVPADAIHVEDKVIPEVDISYFLTKNIAAELVLTIPQEHDVTLLGGKIGTFKHLPPTLLLQYHFLPDQKFRPYVGAGINYTRISNVSLAVTGVGTLDLDSSSTGGALQVGFDVELSKNMFLNVDLKKIYIESDVILVGTGKVSHVDLDPVAIGIGLGWKF